MKLFALILLLGLSSRAGVTDGQYNLKVEKQKITIVSKSGFHLNAEAPAGISFDDIKTNAKPEIKTEKLFSFATAKDAKQANVNFYVCDDKKTVCEKHEEVVDLNVVDKAANVIKKNSDKVAFNTIQDLKLKSVDGRPTLLVFSAPWCPACVRMMTETYDKPEFKKISEKLHFIKLNSDLPENAEAYEKFKIKAIPTIILLDKNGEESFRWLDYQPSKPFAKSVEQELQKVDLVSRTLEAAKLGDPSAAATLAKKAFAALDYAEAYKWYSLTTSPQDQKYKLASEVGLTQDLAEVDDTKAKDYLSALQKAIVLTASKLDQIRWTVDFVEKKSERKELNTEIKIKAGEVFKDIDFMLNNKGVAKNAFLESTYGDYTGFEKDELLWLKGRLAKSVGDEKIEASSKAESIRSIKNKKLSVSRPGEMLIAISYLKEAGDQQTVEPLYQQLTKKYPNTYVYFEKYARFALKNKSLEKALSLAEQAMKYPQGNEPQLGLLKTQVLVDLKKNDEALKTIDETLKTSGIDHKRYAKVVKKLNDIRTELKDGFGK